MLAFGSVLVVVFSILVVNTLVEMGPLVFLSLGEKHEGQIDAILSPNNNGVYSNDDYLHYMNEGQFYNYTQVYDEFPKFNLAPRKQFADPDNCVWHHGECDYERITLIQTEREKEIALGVGYPYQPLGANECLVNKEL
jgi:hypothetical protein